jgi:uncharacterized protein (TIGR02145 family)
MKQVSLATLLIFFLSGSSVFAQNSTAYILKTELNPSKYNVNEEEDNKIINNTIIEDSTNGTFTDLRDGNMYKWVKIGKQVWMSENLAYLPNVNQSSDGSENVAGKYYYVYDYDGTDVNAAKATAYYTIYGVLYNWAAAMDGSVGSTANPSGVQGICPVGWHLPSDAEWTQLTTYLGGESVAGGKLKETGTTYWNSPNAGATNETKFAALSGGYRRYGGTYHLFGINGFWISATDKNAELAYCRSIFYDNSSVLRDLYYKELGFSVRCVRD